MKFKIFGQQGINDEVINHYIHLISKGLENSSKDVEIQRVTSYSEINDGDYCIFYTFADAFRVCIRKRKIKYVIWLQGVYPEERKLKGKSVFDFVLMSTIEKRIIKNAMKVFVVSSAMIDFYERKYKFKIRHKCFIMPCYNDFINKKCFYQKNKYNEPTFTYIGSLSKWQCFDKTLLLFDKIRKKLPNARLYVYTKSVNEAEKIIKELNIDNVKVDCVSSTEVNNVLSKIKYGFIIRDDIAVNNVATPTKFGNYLAAGVIPIFTDSIYFYSDLSKDYKYMICDNEFDNIVEKICDLEKEEINSDVVLEEYLRIFDEYFNDEKNIDSITNFMLDIL